MPNIYETLTQALTQEDLLALATVLDGPQLGQKLLIWPDGRIQGDLGIPNLNVQVQDYALGLFKTQKSEKHVFSVHGKEEMTVFIDVYPPPPKLIMVGAVHIAQPLVTMAKAIGFKTIVLDARGAFATKQRFPNADELIVRWPAEALAEMTIDEATYIVFLTHDEKLDNPALEVVLRSQAHYIGALGSRKTHAKRVEALKEMDLSDEQIGRMYAPVGLDLGGRKPEEIAVSIIAEIVAVRNGQK